MDVVKEGREGELDMASWWSKRVHKFQAEAWTIIREDYAMEGMMITERWWRPWKQVGR